MGMEYVTQCLIYITYRTSCVSVFLHALYVKMVRMMRKESTFDSWKKVQWCLFWTKLSSFLLNKVLVS